MTADHGMTLLKMSLMTRRHFCCFCVGISGQLEVLCALYTAAEFGPALHLLQHASGMCGGDLLRSSQFYVVHFIFYIWNLISFDNPHPPLPFLPKHDNSTVEESVVDDGSISESILLSKEP